MIYFNGKNVLITGAAGGFGGEFTRQLLLLGARLILTDIDRPALEHKAMEIASSVPGATGQIAAVTASDLSTVEGCEALHRFCLENAEPVDMLINNAGILTYGYFHEHPADALERLMAVNMLAPMRLSRLFLPAMVERGSGHIVFISSLAAIVPTAFESSYSASKCGVRGLGMTIAAELKGHGITVTNIYPNFADTGMLKAKSHGSATVRRVGSFMIDSPDMVVRAALRGIAKRRLHVYPGTLTKIIHLAARFSTLVYSLPVTQETD